MVLVGSGQLFIRIRIKVNDTGTDSTDPDPPHCIPVLFWCSASRTAYSCIKLGYWISKQAGYPDFPWQLCLYRPDIRSIPSTWTSTYSPDIRSIPGTWTYTDRISGLFPAPGSTQTGYPVYSRHLVLHRPDIRSIPGTWTYTDRISGLFPAPGPVRISGLFPAPGPTQTG